MIWMKKCLWCERYHESPELRKRHGFCDECFEKINILVHEVQSVTANMPKRLERVLKKRKEG